MNDDEIALANLVAENEGLEIPQNEPEAPETNIQTQKEESVKETPVQPETPSTPTEPATPAPSKTETETSETETNTNTEKQTETQTAAPDWKSKLPPKPVLNQIAKKPELNEDGQITNMNQAEYEEYVIQSAENRVAERLYNQTVESIALSEAEAILPQIKTNQNIRRLVEDARIGQVVNGQPGDIVTAARAIADLLGEAQSTGEQNARTSITIQENAQVTTASAPAPSQEDVKTADIAQRINQNDPEAYIELFDIWQQQGIV